MPANDSKSYLSYLNALVDQYNNTYHDSIGKKPVHDYYSTLSEKLNRVMKLLNLKLVIVSGLLNTIKFLVVSLHQKLVRRNGYTKNWSREIFVVDCVLKLVHGHIKSDLNGEKK